MKNVTASLAHKYIRRATKWAKIASWGAIFAIALRTFLLWQSHDPVNEGNHSVLEGFPDSTPSEHSADANKTLWELMTNDPTISKYVELNEPFDDIRGHLDNASEIYTLYVPIDAAFENQTWPPDAPDFYWKFLSLNHMGPDAVSYDDLLASTTVPNFINHDIYFKNLQRISTKDAKGNIVFNHVANYVGKEMRAVNGYVHRVSTILHLPDAASDLLRSQAKFATFRRGLTMTGLDVQVNDTQSHTSQTLFAPNNGAFEKLGRKVNHFLFSPWGKPYLRALLRYHIVMNSTLFSDVYFLPSKGQIKLNTSSAALQLSTLIPGCNLTAEIVTDGRRQSIMIDDSVTVVDPDYVVMDGVVQELDSILLPPIFGKSNAIQTDAKPKKERDSIAGWFVKLLGGTVSSKISVEDVMERLQPYIDDV